MNLLEKINKGIELANKAKDTESEIRKEKDSINSKHGSNTNSAQKEISCSSKCDILRKCKKCINNELNSLIEGLNFDEIISDEVKEKLKKLKSLLEEKHSLRGEELNQFINDIKEVLNGL